MHRKLMAPQTTVTSDLTQMNLKPSLTLNRTWCFLEYWGQWLSWNWCCSYPKIARMWGFQSHCSLPFHHSWLPHLPWFDFAWIPDVVQKRPTPGVPVSPPTSPFSKLQLKWGVLFRSFQDFFFRWACLITEHLSVCGVVTRRGCVTAWW